MSGAARGHLARRAAQGLGIVLRYVTLELLRSPRRTGRFLRTIGREILAYDHREAGGRIPRRSLEALCPGIQAVDVTLTNASFRDGNVSTEELYALCALARYRRVRRVLEIGTFDGRVTAHLARNLGPDASFVTIDLRPEDLGATRWPLAVGEDLYVSKETVGARIRRLPEPLRERITQVFGDSARLDFSPYYGRMDLVFIDGSHQYQYVEHDTTEAFRLRAPQGLIVWHDYLTWPDVTAYLNRLSQQYPLTHLEGTSLVVWCP
ncbi:MAG TPA: class I SAM-dependent methyltransferase [bacterium]